MKLRSLFSHKIFYLVVALSTITSPCGYAQTSLTIDFNDSLQKIDSFGASDAWSINPTVNKWTSEANEKAIEDLADLLFSSTKGIGLSAWRFNIGAGSAEQGSDSAITDPYRRAELLIASPGAQVDTTKQAGQVRFLREAQERGVTEFIAFANSPPIWATKNKLAHPGAESVRSNIGPTNLKGGMEQEFADFLIEVLQYLRGEKVGVPVNYLSPINEPTWEWEGQSQEANRYNIEDLKAVYRKVHAALKDASLADKVHLDGAESVEYTAALSDEYMRKFSGSAYSGGMNGKGYGLYKNYINELLGDAELRSILGNRLSMHGYFSDAWEDRMGELRDLTWSNLKEVSPDSTVWMTEICILGGGGNVRDFDGEGFSVKDMSLALHIAKMIHRDLTRLNASAWHWWLALTPYDYKDGLIKIDYSLDADTVQDSKVLWTLGNYSRFIRPGYVRVALPGIDNLKGLMASAYKSPDDSTLVVVVINAGSADQVININVSDLPSGKTIQSYTSYITNANNDLANGGTTNANPTVPALSTVTYVASLVALTPTLTVPGT